MNFLAICTVSRSTLISLCVNGQNYTKLLDFSRHSENLFPLLTQLLDEHNLTLDDFDCFGCVVGPGSFTGIRIGMSVVKGFAFALNKPVVAVNSLELLAYNRLNTSNSRGILAVINAGANMVYHQAFEVVGNKLQPLYQPKLDTYTHFVEFTQFRFNNDIDVVFSQNDEKGADYSADFGGNHSFELSSLTQIMEEKISAHEFTSAVEVSPLYLRVSSAEQNIRDVQFVKLTADQIDSICELECQNDEFDLPWSKQATLSSMNNPNFDCYGLINKDGVWGMISVMNNDTECEILRVVVLKKARELGLGNKLLQGLINVQKLSGRSAIFLEVNEHNFPAISLYKRNGFMDIGKRPKYYHNRDSAILMKLPLN